MYKEPYFEWVEELGQATCIITDTYGHIYIGVATCHPDDKDMMSRRTGEEIAFRRARMESLKAMRDAIKTEIGTLKQLYYSMNQSSHFNENSYENKMLQRRIHMKTFDLDTIKEMLTTEYESLTELIKEKDKFYKQVRGHRNKAKSIQEN